MKIFFTILTFVLVSCTKEKQEARKRESGVVQDDARLVAKVPLISSQVFNAKKVKPVPLPTLQTKVTLITPPVGNQGNEGTCVPYSTVHAARAIEGYYKTGVMSLYSVEYVFNQTKMGTDCNSGTAITLTLELMKNKGVCLSAQMPSVDGDCYTMPNDLQNSQAAANKITGYYKVESTDSTAIKTLLINKHPVIISVIMDNAFVNAAPGFIWRSYSGSGSFPHTMTIVGYDDSKKAYKVMNSWGITWGDSGFSWIDYTFFLTKTGYYVYTIQL